MVCVYTVSSAMAVAGCGCWPSNVLGSPMSYRSECLSRTAVNVSLAFLDRRHLPTAVDVNCVNVRECKQQARGHLLRADWNALSDIE